jgi:chitinase
MSSSTTVSIRVCGLLRICQLIIYLLDGSTVYTDCTSLLTRSPASFPKSSLFEIAASGVSLNKLLIGKPVIAQDASNGLMTAQLLGQCVQQAVSKNWAGGIMGFEVCLL